MSSSLEISEPRGSETAVNTWISTGMKKIYRPAHTARITATATNSFPKETASDLNPLIMGLMLEVFSRKPGHVMMIINLGVVPDNDPTGIPTL